MSIKNTTYQNLAAGTTLTAANSGFTAMTSNFVATVINSRTCAVATAPGTSISIGRITVPELASVVKYLFPFSYSAIPAAERTIAQINFGTSQGTDTASTFAVKVTITAAGKFRVYTGGATGSTSRYISTASIPTGSDYRLEIYSEAGTSATTGMVHAAIYPYSSSTPITDGDFTLTGTDIAGTGGGFTNVIGGKNSGDSASDNIVLLPGLTVKSQADAVNSPEPLGSTALTANLVLSPNSGTLPYSITATVNTSGGTNINRTFAMDWGDGTTSPAQASNTFTKTISGSSSFTGRTATATVSEDSA